MHAFPVLLALQLAAIPWQTQAQVVQLVDQNSSCLIQSSTQAGIFNLSTAGFNQLF